MHQQRLAPSTHGPRRLRVSSIHAGRSSGDSTAYRKERAGPPRGRAPWADRVGGRGREGDEQRLGHHGGGEYGTGKRYGHAYSRERRRQEGEQWRGGGGDGGGNGGSNSQRRERLFAEATPAVAAADNQQQQQWRPRPRPSAATTRSSSDSSSSGPQRKWKVREREENGRNDEADEEYDGEHDEDLSDDDDAEEGDERGGQGGAAATGAAGRRAPTTIAAGPCLRDTLQGEALYGVFPVLAALRAKRRRVHRAFMLSSLDLSKRKDAGLIRQVEALCTEAGVEVVRAGRHELNLMSHDRPHQGLVLDVAPLEWASLDEFPPADEVLAAADAVHNGSGGGRTAAPPVWLALDEVVDPQNLGAVVRSAYCLGAAGVLACSRNCAPLSPVVSKASAGALEALQLHSCRSLPRTLIDARDLKGWTVLGAAAGGGSEPVGRVRVSRPTILVLGSEGFGLRTNVRRACSGLVRVDMAPTATNLRAGGGSAATTAAVSTPSVSSSSSRGVGGVKDADAIAATARRPQPQQAVLRGLVDSLNVSVATGILLHSLINSAAAATTITALGPAAAVAAGTAPTVEASYTGLGGEALEG